MKKFKWFPDKGQNLHQHKVRYISGRYTYDKNKFKFFETLSRKLNFTLKPKNFPLKEIPSEFGYSRNLIIVNYTDLLEKNENFITFIFNYYHKCHGPELLRSRILYLQRKMAVVPHLPARVSTDVFSCNFFFSILSNVFVILVSRQILLRLKVNRETLKLSLAWNFLLFRIVLNSTEI